MTITQFEKAEKIMKEIRETEKFMKIYGKSYIINLEAEANGATSLDSSIKRYFRVLKDSGLYNDIMGSFKRRIDELLREFEAL